MKKGKNPRKDVSNIPDHVRKKKKTKSYQPSKRDIKKYIPKDIDLTPISLFDDKRQEGKMIDTEDTKIKERYVPDLSRIYYGLCHKLNRTKEELRLLKRELPAHVRNIERSPKEIDALKKALIERKKFLKKEEETPGYIVQISNKILERFRQKVKENPKEIEEEERIKVEEFYQTYNLERLKKEIDFLETRIEILLETQEDSKDIKIIYSHKIEELEEFIKELEPKVKMLKDKLDKESKKLKAERNTNLMKLFDKEERENNNS